MKRHFLVLIVAIVCLLGLTAQAQAISNEYCDYSLNAGGSLAPDNDYAHGNNVVSSWFGRPTLIRSKQIFNYGSTVNVTALHYYGWGPAEAYSLYTCSNASGTYHDWYVKAATLP